MSEVFAIDDFKEIIDEFISESEDMIGKVDQELVVLEKEPGNPDLLNSIFRAIHTIKGTSSFLGLTKITDFTHVVESVLSKLRNNEISLSSDLMDIILESVDIIKILINDIKEKKTTEVDTKSVIENINIIMNSVNGQNKITNETMTKKESITSKPLNDSKIPGNEKKENKIIKESEVIEVPEEQVDHLMEKDEKTKEILLTKQDSPVITDNKKEDLTIKVPIEKLDKMLNLVGELIVFKNNFQYLSNELNDKHNLKILGKSAKNTGDALNRIADELQVAIMSARMLPIGSVFARFPRMVRDLSRKMNKKVKLVMQGEDTTLDKTVIEIIGDPLIHLIRNCVDHGIETPAKRISAGKPEEGTILLTAFNYGQSVIIQIEDDGKGINTDYIKNKVLEKELLSAEELNSMNDKQLMNLIFLPGFSTAEKVTEVSGRGVGMDVVKTNIEKVGGTVLLERTQGTCIRTTLILPLTLAIRRGVDVECAGQHYYIPLDYIKETVKISADNIAKHKNIEMIAIRDKIMPFYRLKNLIGQKSASIKVCDNGNGNEKSCEILLEDVHNSEEQNLQKTSNNKMLDAIILNINGNNIALGVDKVNDQESFMVKPLSGLSEIKIISGVVVTASGEVILVLNPPAMF